MLAVYTLYIALALTTALAFKMGGRAERAGVLWLLLNVGIGLVNELSGLHSALAHLVADGVFAMGLLPFAIYFVSWWVGVQTLLAAVGFGIEAAYLMTDQPTDAFFVNSTNLLFGALLLNLSMASIGSAWDRRREERKALLKRTFSPASAFRAVEAD